MILCVQLDNISLGFSPGTKLLAARLLLLALALDGGDARDCVAPFNAINSGFVCTSDFFLEICCVGSEM